MSKAFDPGAQTNGNCGPCPTRDKPIEQHAGCSTLEPDVQTAYTNTRVQIVRKLGSEAKTIAAGFPAKLPTQPEINAMPMGPARQQLQAIRSQIATDVFAEVRRRGPR